MAVSPEDILPYTIDIVPQFELFTAADWALACAAFVLGLGIFFVIGIFNIDDVKPMTWVGPALSIYLWGGGPLVLALYIPSRSIRLTVFTVLLLAELTVIVGYWLQERRSRRYRTR